MSERTMTASKTASGAPPAASFPRHEQTFPALTLREIARMRRFAEIRNYSEKLFVRSVRAETPHNGSLPRYY